MNNTSKKNNARTGGAVTSPQNRLEFINTGHAAQSRYLAALANPFASPAVPIPDSFLTAHVSKFGFETVLTNCRGLKLGFFQSSNDPTGDYTCHIDSWDGSVWTRLRTAVSEIGARFVAGGIAYEDASPADSIGGVVTYKQINKAFDGGIIETVDSDVRTERNRGDGAVVYQLMRRQALEFEGNAYTELEITFSQAITVVAKFVAILETDGNQGFTEIRTSSKDFLTTSSYQNHHAGVFADIPMPDFDQSIMPISHTAIEIDGNGAHQGALSAAAHWVASAAGWVWKHKDTIGKVVNRLPQYYHAAVHYGGSIVSHTGQILSLGARAAPLMLTA